MQALSSPSLTPTSQVQGGAEGNAEAMTAKGAEHIPVGTQKQPAKADEDQGVGAWMKPTVH